MPTEAWKKENVAKLRKYRRDHYYRNREHYLEAVKAAKAQKRQELLAKDADFQEYIRTHPTKTCRTCGTEGPTLEFPIHTSGGKRLPTHECSVCHSRHKKAGGETENARQQRRDRNRSKRKDPLFRASIIVGDYKKNDKKHGREFDLDIPFVDELIQNGCLYCGNRSGMMVLDRIDNAIGHTKNNVNPACYRCNSIRNDMPYELWLSLVPVIRKLQKQGKFGDWRATRSQSREE